MDWSNERYVRLYTRDTPDWVLLSWEARSLWVLILRKLDRSGVMDMGRHGMRALSASVGMPLDVVERALPELLDDGCLLQNGSKLVAPNFLEAQESVASDAQRKRESRARIRERAISSVTERDVRSRDGTESHARSRAVTRGHSVPSLAVPSLTKPEKEIPPDPGGSRLADSLRELILKQKPDHKLADPAAWRRQRPAWVKAMAPIAAKRTVERAQAVMLWVFGEQGGRTEFRFRLDSPAALERKFDAIELAMRTPRANVRVERQLQDWGRSDALLPGGKR